VKNSPRRTAAVVLVFLSSAGLVAQKSGPGGAELTVSVTVAPVCTVAVTRDESSAHQAVAVRCRNFAISQPQPIISHMAIETTGEGSATFTEGVAMVVINF
jgi:hypothetical protein